MNKTMIDRLHLPKRQKEALRNSRITDTFIADAIVQRDRLTFDEKVRYVEIIIERQPQLAGTIVVLKRLGVNEAALDPLVDLLLMVTIALENAQLELLPASETLVELCYERVTTRITQESNLQLPPLQISKTRKAYLQQCPEQWLQAYAFTLVGPLQQSAEEDQVVVMLTMAILTVVEVFTELLHPHWDQKQAY